MRQRCGLYREVVGSGLSIESYYIYVSSTNNIKGCVSLAKLLCLQAKHCEVFVIHRKACFLLIRRLARAAQPRY